MGWYPCGGTGPPTARARFTFAWAAMLSLLGTGEHKPSVRVNPGAGARDLPCGMSTTVGELSATIESIAPPGYAEPWDNVGLLVGDPAAAVNGPGGLTLDLPPGGSTSASA